MEEFITLENVEKLFNEQGCKGKENIYDVLFKDTRKYSGMVKGMEYPFDALLVNFTDEGIGFFQLAPAKFSLKVTLEKLVVKKDTYTFIKNEDIKSIEVKKFAPLNKKVKSVIIKTNDKKEYYLYGRLNDDKIPYHNEMFAKIIEKYSK